MTALTAAASWDDVPQLEITTPLLGGAGGPMNLQAQALTNRFAYLAGAQGATKVSGTWFNGAVATVAALATVAGAAMIGYQPVGGTASRSIADRLSEVMSVKDFTTPSGADVAGNLVYVPAAGATMSDKASGAALNASYYGPGQIITADGNKRGRYFTTLTQAPAVLGNHNGIDTAFNGSGPMWSYEHRITGAATLGQPATGFVMVPEACTIYGVIRNASGWNQSTSGNDGRTAVSFLRMKAFHAGAGGTNLMTGTIVLSSTNNPSNTSFLAGAAGCVYTGDYYCTTDGNYMDAFEVQFNDQGHDAAAMGYVKNFNRTNATGANYAWWAGDRVQSIGSQPIDVVWSASGKTNIGTDYSMLTLTGSGTYTSAAIVMKAGQRIYLNASGNDASGMNRFSDGLGTTYIAYSTGSTSITLVAGNNSSLQVGASTVITTVATHLGHGANDYLIANGGNATTSITAAGPTNPDVAITYVTKGAGTHSFQTAGGTKQFEVIDTASAVNYIQGTGSATGLAVGFTAIGTDAAINFKVAAKGTGVVVLQSNGANQVQVAGPASAVNQVQFQGSTGSNPVIVGASGTGTNLDVQISPKGTGLLRYGTYAAKAAEAFAGYITINDSGGTARKVMVCA